MTGEKLAWFRVASHLKIPLCELKERITYSEFLDWFQYLDQVDEESTKSDYALAQIAAEVRRSYSKKPRGVKTKDFLVKVVREPTAPQPQAVAQSSKKVWAAAVGANLKKKKK